MERANQPLSSEIGTGNDTATDAYVCPKCRAENRPNESAEAQSCRSCGVLFGRFYAQFEDRFEADFRLAGFTDLVDAWKDVLADYENLAVHRQFVETCAAHGHLEFAAYRYRVLNQVINDEIAEAQLKQIAALAQIPFETVAEPARPFALPRYHLWFFVLGGLFLWIGLLGVYSFRALGIAALIFLCGLYAIRLASDARY